MRDDRELLEAWRGGDARAGNELFGRHFNRLFAFFSSKASSGVEDLIQQTLTACVESRDKFRGDSSFRAYLFGIARHILYAHYKKKQRPGQAFDATMTSLVELGPSPATLAGKRAEERLLAAALQRIPLDLQIALELHYWEDMSATELAAVLDIPAGTAKSRLRRAKEALRERMVEVADADDDVDGTWSDLGRWASNLRLQFATDD